MSRVDDALKKLGVGVKAWVTTFADSTESGAYWSRSLGYDKISSKWGIAIKREWGHESSDDSGGEEMWLFNDAPREFRLEAVPFLRELVKELIKQSAITTASAAEQMLRVNEIAGELNQIIQSEPKTK